MFKLSGILLHAILAVLLSSLFINLNSQRVFAAEKAPANGFEMGMGMMGKTTMPVMGGYCLFGGCLKGDEAFLLSKLDQIFIANYNSLSAFKANLEGLSNEYQFDLKAPFSDEQKILIGKTLYTSGEQTNGKELDLLVSDIPENAYEYLYAKYLNQLDGQLVVAKSMKESGNDKWSEEITRNIQHTKEIIKYLESKIQKRKQISSCDSGRFEHGKFVDGQCHTRTVEEWVLENQEKEREALQETVPVNVPALKSTAATNAEPLDLSRDSDKVQCFDELVQFFKSRREIARPTNMLSEIEELENVYRVNTEKAAVEYARLNAFNKCSSVNFRIYSYKGKKYLFIDSLVLNENGLDAREFKNYWSEAVRNPAKTATSNNNTSGQQLLSAPLSQSNK